MPPAYWQSTRSQSDNSSPRSNDTQGAIRNRGGDLQASRPETIGAFAKPIGHQGDVLPPYSRPWPHSRCANSPDPGCYQTDGFIKKANNGASIWWNAIYPYVKSGGVYVCPDSKYDSPSYTDGHWGWFKTAKDPETWSAQTGVNSVFGNIAIS